MRTYDEFNTQFKGKLERIGGALYDTVSYVSGTSVSLTFFSATRASLDLSNMEIAGQLPAPSAFLVRAIRFFVKQRPRSIVRAAAAAAQTGAVDNIAQLVNTGVAVPTIGAKQYGQYPLHMLTCGGGPFGIFALEGATADPGGAADYAQCGIADPRAVYTLGVPLFIDTQINFSVTLTWLAALTLAGGNTDLSIILDGERLRPIQ